MTDRTDNVNHPSHYNQGEIECKVAANAMISSYPDPIDAALSWQVLKYLWRHPFKENPLQDLEKAQSYLNDLIQHYRDKTDIDNEITIDDRVDGIC